MHILPRIFVLLVLGSVVLLSCKDHCPGIVVSQITPQYGAAYTAIDSLLVFEDAKSHSKLYMNAEYLTDKTVLLIIKSKSDYLSLERTAGETFPLQIKCGNDSHEFKSQAYAGGKQVQFEESAVYAIAADSMKTILDERYQYGGSLLIGRFSINFSDELACGLKKLMKPAR